MRKKSYFVGKKPFTKYSALNIKHLAKYHLYSKHNSLIKLMYNLGSGLELYNK